MNSQVIDFFYKIIWDNNITNSYQKPANLVEITLEKTRLVQKNSRGEKILGPQKTGVGVTTI
jgi:hypothetical protein